MQGNTKYTEIRHCPNCGHIARQQYEFLTCSNCHRAFYITELTDNAVCPQTPSGSLPSFSRAPSVDNRPTVSPADGAKLFCPNCYQGSFTLDELVEHLMSEHPERYDRPTARLVATCWQRVLER